LWSRYKQKQPDLEGISIVQAGFCSILSQFHLNLASFVNKNSKSCKHKVGLLIIN
jgi:hypothetical protein